MDNNTYYNAQILKLMGSIEEKKQLCFHEVSPEIDAAYREYVETGKGKLIHIHAKLTRLYDSI